jgi:CRISPR-associated protein Cas6
LFLEARAMNDPVVDVQFPLRGEAIPLDHGYLLFAAVSKVVPRIHEERAWAIHPVRGTRASPGKLAFDRSSRLSVRLPASEIAAVLPLAGATLNIGLGVAHVGAPRVMPLRSRAALASRFVNIKKFQGDLREFELAVRRQIAALPGLGQDPERVNVAVGPRRVMRIAEYTIVGFPVTLDGLEVDASLAIQRHGIGGRRHMGAGIFVPPGRRA